MNAVSTLTSYSPIDGKKIGEAPITALSDVEAAIERAQAAFRVWRNVPAPVAANSFDFLVTNYDATKMPCPLW